ncbi:hypothetical protein RQM65_01955 [Pricia sp. S334]|uniref:Uncharacterized protein n=1 Tax=Pricia mediterranea TaxID=3076079 RepID=A0ABU3L148_9FLAO|nr:hypothetical protein [Pricia sp. S334]MDT7827426.1 hypothetical protein [Pricia sp. S334]
MDRKEDDKDTEFIKEEHDEKRNYIFQKSRVTKVAAVIVIVFLIIIIIGLVVSGTTFFDSSV